ncbi:MAG: hypothetical protein KDL87_00325 [Verrucomicrobiae bacterium]|nr:hypothetical protein [Verrucomicrobiae bacterium]
MNIMDSPGKRLTQQERFEKTRTLIFPDSGQACRQLAGEVAALIRERQAEGKPVVGLDPAAIAKKIDDFSGADIKAMFDQAIEAALGEAMKSGQIVPVSQKMLLQTAKQVKPSTRKWFESAKNYALYANQSGFYDDVLDYLGIRKP